MPDNKAITVNQEQMDSYLMRADAHRQAIEACKKRLEAIDTRFYENQNLEGYTAEEVKQNNLRCNKSAYGLYTLADALITATRMAAQGLIAQDATMAD